MLSCFSMACFGWRRVASSVLPFLFELHRNNVVSVECSRVRLYQISQLRVSSWPGGGFEALPCSRSTLREPNSVRAGVVPAVALAAHRGRDATLVERLDRGWHITAAIAVEDQRSVLAGRALEPGHLQASMTSSLLMLLRIDQPTIRRLNKSITTARYSHPSSVGNKQHRRPCPVRRSHGEVVDRAGWARPEGHAGCRW